MSGWTTSGRGASSPLKDPESPSGAGTRLDARRTTASEEALLSKRDDKTAGAIMTSSSISQSQDAASQRYENQTDPSSVQSYREQLMREMSSRGGRPRMQSLKRPSPIQEERATPPTLLSGLTSTSSESAGTIRGNTPSLSARTPSYPFPSMRTPGSVSSSLHRPFTTLSPTGLLDVSRGNQPDTFRLVDKVLSNPSTPASTLTFQPGGLSHAGGDNPDFPSPDLYDLALMLTAEPGLEAWWNTVVQIMTECFAAERVTLAVPADSTDLENVPWGQKATFNSQETDERSMGYLARGSSFVASTTGTATETPPVQAESYRSKLSFRPGLPSRHSFTSYEDKKEKTALSDTLRAPTSRPGIPRSKSSFPVSSLREELLSVSPAHAVLNQATLAEHDAGPGQDVEIPSWEAPLLNQQQEGQGRVLAVLQALDYEADPLIDHNGVQRILDRGKVIALTRSYPYLEGESGGKPDENAPTEVKEKPSRTRSESTSKLSALLGGVKSKSSKAKRVMVSATRADDDGPRPRTPKYEEYEQAPPSPWSQSPAPSPAIRADPTQNPFFTDVTVDEESFNPGSIAHDYGPQQKAPETIGVDNSWTVLHIPLTHPVLSKPTTTFKLDPAMIEQKSLSRRLGAHHMDAHTPAIPSPDPTSRKKAMPIAILSILSQVIPYPSNLRHSIENLAPHIATSFSLCRQYSNLEAEVSGFNRRRPVPEGFGAVGADGRQLVNTGAFSNFAYVPPEELALHRSMAGSMTSPSDYSGPSRSTPGGTPNWDPSVLGLVTDKRVGNSPSPINADSYFSTRPVTSPGRPVTTPGAASRSRTSSKDQQMGNKRLSLRISGNKMAIHDAEVTSPAESVSEGSTEALRRVSDESAAAGHGRRVPSRGEKEAAGEQGTSENSDISAPRLTTTDAHGKPAPNRHSQLHSYGADFATTFQSLPPSSTIPIRGVAQGEGPSRSSSLTSPVVMPPPSDRLKGMILDSLPAHVFVALPQTGAIVWVNSRFMAYRGLTVETLVKNPWSSIHPDEREDYLKAWSHCVRTGDQFSRTCRIRRFDGAYRWFHARAVANRDKRNHITQYHGSYMDIHDQHVAELKAARQEEIEASEAKHRLLANLIPQIIFTATEDEGITFANEQWLSYCGQSFEDSLGLNFLNFVHPDDLAKCEIPALVPAAAAFAAARAASAETGQGMGLAGVMAMSSLSKSVRQGLSRNSSSGSSTTHEPAVNELAELAKKGILKVTTDSSGRLSYTMELRLRTKANEYRWHLIRCVVIEKTDFGNGVSSYFGSATDINDLKQLEAKLKEAMDSKGRFLSNMSHEIRTPLIGISGMVSFLQDTTLNEEQRDYTNTIQTSANSLLMIINDILDLSKVDAGMMKLNHEWFHTRSLIEDVNELVSTMAIAKRLELNYVVEADVPAWVKGDKVRIRQVLLNVIGNAIKFTAEGEVFSRCQVLTGGDALLGAHEIMLEFSIIDTGRGFTKEEAELIFKPFSQIDGSSTRQHGGSGLGLVISRQLVELHGGTMRGSAAPGKGSTFTFTARFDLPSDDDHPDVVVSPKEAPPATPYTEELQAARPFKHFMPGRILGLTPTASPTNDAESMSTAQASSGSSEPSIGSVLTRATDRSSISSVNVGLARFSEAARASGQDLSQMKLEMPGPSSASEDDPTPLADRDDGEDVDFRPPMYSILIICPQTHSREATTKHIEMTLPKDVPHQITALDSVAGAQKFIAGDDPVTFTHIVINLPSAEELVGLVVQLEKAAMLSKTHLLILSDSVQRQAVMKLAASKGHGELLAENRVTYIYKPVKPSRFAVIFDPGKERDLSIDRNRSTAQRIVENQKQSYLDMEKRMGNKGYKVLLVEDNPVNQKVLQKYLKKVGVEVDVANDGIECTEKVFRQDHGYYSLILCDLHMPRKDGYEACRDIRHWEGEHGYTQMPIIALSANVMSDVQEKCVAAGFSDYVTKPVDFIDLSRALSKFF